MASRRRDKYASAAAKLEYARSAPLHCTGRAGLRHGRCERLGHMSLHMCRFGIGMQTAAETLFHAGLVEDMAVDDSLEIGQMVPLVDFRRNATPCTPLSRAREDGVVAPYDGGIAAPQRRQKPGGFRFEGGELLPQVVDAARRSFLHKRRIGCGTTAHAPPEFHQVALVEAVQRTFEDMRGNAAQPVDGRQRAVHGDTRRCPRLQGAWSRQRQTHPTTTPLRISRHTRR